MFQKINQTEILGEFQKLLIKEFPGQLERLILFGSYARGDISNESDLDVLAVMDWEEKQSAGNLYASPYSDLRWRRIVDLAYDLSLEYGIIVAPFVMSKKQFQQWSPLTSQVKQDGIEIWKKN